MYDVATRQNSPQDQLEALQKLITLDKPSNSKNYYASYIHISDSLKKAEKVVQNKYAKIKYDSEINREENLQLKIVNVNPIPTVEYPTPAKRPMSSRLSAEKLQSKFKVLMPGWREELESCVDELRD